MRPCLVVEGQGGAAKTPLCHRLVQRIDGAIYVHPFHEVAADIGHDVFPLWDSDPRRALDLLTRAITRPRDAAVVVFDRGWLTVCRGLEGAGHQAMLHEALALHRWTAFVDQDEAWVRRNSRRLADHGLPPWDLTEDFAARRRWVPRCAWRGHLHGEADLDGVADAIHDAWNARTTGM